MTRMRTMTSILRACTAPAILAAAIFLSVGVCAAQSMKTANTLRLDDPANSPEASIQDVAWMAGHWKADAFGGETEEIWAPPFGDSMIGMYKIVRDDVSTLYEFFSLVEEDGSLTVKLKHFNADMTGWEAVDGYMSFPLVRLEPNAAYFDGLTYRRVDARHLRAHLALSDGGDVSEVTFDYELVNPLRDARPVPSTK